MNSHSIFKIPDSKFLFLALLLLLLLSVSALVSAQEQSGRPLEVDYPRIPGVTVVPEKIGIELPQYVNYIFVFALAVIGFIIFGVLIYNGILYLTSTGAPAVLTEARKRLIAAVFGAAVLIGAYLIFNTINPQLTRLEIKKAELTRDPATPGIYVCDDRGDAERRDRISSLVQGYINTREIEAQRKIVQQMRDIMERRKCKRMNISGNFDFTVRQGRNTFFSIPALQIEQGQAAGFSYEHGVILHEDPNYKGKAKVLVLTPANRTPYGQIGPFPEFDFAVRSFTLFRRVEPFDPGENQGVVLYACLNYNEPPFACKQQSDQNVFLSFPVGNATLIEAREANLRAGTGTPTLAENTRSIKIDDPKQRFFAVLFDRDNFTANETAQVVTNSIRNLHNTPIGRCGNWCWFIRQETEQKQLNSCNSCLKSMLIIRGQVIR